LLDPNLRVVRMNPPAELMLGYTEWEVYGQPVENVLIGPDELVSALEAACRGIPMHDIGNVTLHRRNGQSFPVQIQTIPVHKDGELLGVLVSAMDVSENEQIRVRTQQLEHRAVLGELTAIFAHEVRNPINNVSTGLQLMASRLMETDPNQELINRMQGDCARLNHLMESVLSFSRPIEHKFETVDLAVLLQRILDRWRPRFAKVNVKPFFQADEKTPPVTGDPRTLEQVFTNLFSNAVEAMSKTGGILAVKITPNDTIANRPQVEVSVSDNGPGIPDEIRDRIFEPFVTTNSKGTGLGLAITKRIVTEHQGNISVNSFPGGTVFHVYLPAFNGD
jgi:two-component system, NtrC family, sensor histidine kinase AtoS